MTARNRQIKTVIWRFEVLKRSAAGRYFKYFLGNHWDWRGDDLQKEVEEDMELDDELDAESDEGREDLDLGDKVGVP